MLGGNDTHTRDTNLRKRPPPPSRPCTPPPLHVRSQVDPACHSVRGCLATRSPFHMKLDQIRVGCGVTFQMLFAFAARDGTAVHASKTVEDVTLDLGQVAAHESFLSEAGLSDLGSDQDSQVAWTITRVPRRCRRQRQLGKQLGRPGRRGRRPGGDRQQPRGVAAGPVRRGACCGGRAAGSVRRGACGGVGGRGVGWGGGLAAGRASASPRATRSTARFRPGAAAAAAAAAARTGDCACRPSSAGPAARA